MPGKIKKGQIQTNIKNMLLGYKLVCVDDKFKNMLLGYKLVCVDDKFSKPN